MESQEKILPQKKIFSPVELGKMEIIHANDLIETLEYYAQGVSINGSFFNDLINRTQLTTGELVRLSEIAQAGADVQQRQHVLMRQ